MRCPSLVHGNGIIYSTKMSYDTGCSSIVIHDDELPFFIPLIFIPTLNYTCVYTAVGPVPQPILTLEARVLDPTHTGVVRNWHPMNAIVMDSSERIGPQPLAGVFLCSHRDGQALYCARSKTQFIRHMPA